MRWRATAVTTLLACWTLSVPVTAQVAAPEAEILRKVGETYRHLGAYLMEGKLTITAKSDRGPRVQEVPFLIAAASGGRKHDEIMSPTVGGSIISDGTHTVLYNAPLGQYMRRSGPADSANTGGTRGFGATLIDRYSDIAKGATAAKRLPDAALSLAGGQRDCYVIEVAYPPTTTNAQIQELPRTYWIEKSTHLVLRQKTVVKASGPQYGSGAEQEEDFSLRRAALNPVLPDSLWAFRPPARSREVTEFAPNGSNPFEGKDAIDFTLKDSAGRAHSLKGLRGKVVLLDFWATWCGPCRITLPRVAKIHSEYKNRGVEVMSINVGEVAAKATAYMKKNGYTFTTLLDPTSKVSGQYQVNSIPTLIVINREGVVSDYMVGVRDEAALRAALKKAGVQ